MRGGGNCCGEKSKLSPIAPPRISLEIVKDITNIQYHDHYLTTSSWSDIKLLIMIIIMIIASPRISLKKVKMYIRSWIIINDNHESWIMEIMKILSRSWFIMMDHGWWRKKSNHHGHYNHQKGCTWSQHRVQVELLGLEEASLGDFHGMSRFQQI